MFSETNLFSRSSSRCQLPNVPLIQEVTVLALRLIFPVDYLPGSFHNVDLPCNTTVRKFSLTVVLQVLRPSISTFNIGLNAVQLRLSTSPPKLLRPTWTEKWQTILDLSDSTEYAISGQKNLLQTINAYFGKFVPACCCRRSKSRVWFMPLNSIRLLRHLTLFYR